MKITLEIPLRFSTDISSRSPSVICQDLEISLKIPAGICVGTSSGVSSDNHAGVPAEIPEKFLQVLFQTLEFKVFIHEF